MAGAIAGAAGTAASQAFLTVGNHIAFGDPLMSGKEFIKGVIFGAVVGGAFNGVAASSNGRTFWKGTLPNPKVTPISLPSSVGIQKGQAPEITTDAKLPSSTQSNATPTTQNSTATAINKELGAVDVSKNPNFGIQDKAGNGVFYKQIDPYSSAGYKSLDLTDLNHSFSNIVDNNMGNAAKFTIEGGDGVYRSLYQIEGASAKGVNGIFEWMVENGGNCTHRAFIPGGKITGIPNKWF